VIPVPDDDVARRWDITNEVLGAEGFVRYEISNWTKPGRSSKHNSLYWRCGEYLGIGAGAHSHLASTDGAIRSWTVKSPERYATGARPAGAESIDARTRATEVMMLGLRTSEGVTRTGFAELVRDELDAVFGGEIRTLRDRGLIDDDGERIVVVRPFLLNEVVVAFV
jgi:oxygen-independent coproporphyrinogen-3 oxidase